MNPCPGCGMLFSCAMAEPGDAAPCWCSALTPLPAATIATVAGTNGARCLCPACLAAARPGPAILHAER